MDIREASQADAEALSRLAIETYAAAFGHLMSAADLDAHVRNNLLPEHFGRILKRDSVLVAEVDGRMVGYVQIGRAGGAAAQTAGNDWELRRLYVLAWYQNRGIGTRLMEAALDQLAQNGADRIFLDVWEHNRGARRFYERFGFEVIGAREFVVESGAQTDPDLIMVRQGAAKGADL